MSEEVKQPLVWGIVEVMGHSSYGGVLEEIEQLGAKFLRVTVPENERHNEFTVDLSAQSIFRIRRCNEEAARAHWSDAPGDVGKKRPPLAATPALSFAGSVEGVDDDDDRDEEGPPF